MDLGNNYDERCQRCASELEILKGQSSTYNMTKSCSTCILENINEINLTPYSALIKNFYIPIYRDCAFKGTVEA